MQGGRAFTLRYHHYRVRTGYTVLQMHYNNLYCSAKNATIQEFLGKRTTLLIQFSFLPESSAVGVGLLSNCMSYRMS